MVCSPNWAAAASIFSCISGGSDSRGIVLYSVDDDFCSSLFSDFLRPLLDFISQARSLFGRKVAQFDGMLY